MAKLETQTMAWAATAPVQHQGSAHSAASPEAVFALLADHETWPEWMTILKEVTVTGAAAGVGARRRVRLRGATVDEEFIAWEPGRLFAFTGTHATPKICRSLVEHCRLEPTADGGTDITWTMCVDPGRGPAGAVLRLGGRMIRKTLTTGMQNLARRAEG